ncbi:MAG: SDR family oxidoreductase [Bdellovibrionaceae bacterium]|nr:SDR family oxidoreductase [Pseudobdellovibrionaceae bacterium]
MSSTVASITMGLTRLGADCILLDPQNSVPQPFINQINDSREINDKFGRAAVIATDLSTAAVIKDVIGRASQVFGGLDIFIDAMVINHPTPLKIDGGIDGIEGLDLMLERHLKSTLVLTQGVLAFFKSRKRGRIIYLLNDPPPTKKKEDVLVCAVRSGLIPFAAALAKQINEANITVNTLSLALTEEYILGHDLDSKSIKEAMEKMKLQDSSLRITEPDKTSQVVSFLASTLGTSITGQHLSLS